MINRWLFTVLAVIVFGLPAMGQALADHAQPDQPKPPEKVLPHGGTLNRAAGKLVVAGPLLASVFLPSLFGDRKATPDEICSMTLGQIGAGIINYLKANKLDTMPPDLSVVMEKGFLAPDFLLCPTSGKSIPVHLNKDEQIKWALKNTDYEYIGGGVKLGDKNLRQIVIAYDKGDHGGAGPFTVYGDCHVSHESLITLERALAESKKLREQANNNK